MKEQFGLFRNTKNTQVRLPVLKGKGRLKRKPEGSSTPV